MAIHIDCRALDRILEADFFNGLAYYRTVVHVTEL
jgi:hypothetical protein